MRNDIPKGERLQFSIKQRPYWGLINPTDHPKTNWKYSLLIAQLQARYKANDELSKDKPDQKFEDYSV